MEPGATPLGLAQGRCRLVIIGDFDFVGISCLPTKTNSILIVDTDTMLTLPIASKSLQTISGRDGEIAEVANPIEQVEFPLRDWP